MPYFDTDRYFWEATDPPFTGRRPAAVRDAQLTHDLAQNPGYLVGGSLVGWGEQ